MNEIQREHAEDDKRDAEIALESQNHCANCDEEFSIHGPKTCSFCGQRVCNRCWSVTYECCAECAVTQWKDLLTEIITGITEGEHNYSHVGPDELDENGTHTLAFEARRGPDIKVTITEKEK